MKQVFLARWGKWADVTGEDDEWIYAIDPLDGLPTMVDKNYPHLVRPKHPPESDVELL